MVIFYHVVVGFAAAAAVVLIATIRQSVVTGEGRAFTIHMNSKSTRYQVRRLPNQHACMVLLAPAPRLFLLSGFGHD